VDAVAKADVAEEAAQAADVAGTLRALMDGERAFSEVIEANTIGWSTETIKEGNSQGFLFRSGLKPPSSD
jgi:translation elongation factor P/translation initiation factor 5A